MNDIQRGKHYCCMLKRDKKLKSIGVIKFKMKNKRENEKNRKTLFYNNTKPKTKKQYIKIRPMKNKHK